MKVIIIGAGAAGSIIAKFLCDSDKVEQVLVGDIDQAKAKKFLIQHPKLSFKEANAKHIDEIAALATGFDLLINASLPEFNEFLMQAALKAGVNYQDLASDYDNAEIEQLKYHEQFKAKNLIGLINASASPGVTNLVARDIACHLTKIESVKIRLLEDVSSEIPFTAWSKAVTFDEFYWKPFVWEQDKFVEKDNFAEEEVYNFQEPFLNQKCYLIAQEDIGSMPKYIKAKHIDLKAGGSEIDLARTLFKLGIFKKHPIKVGDTSISPYDYFLKIWPDVLSPDEMKKLVDSGKLNNAHFWASVEESGYEDGKKVVKKALVLFPDQKTVNKLYPGATYISYAAGLSAAVFALAIPDIKSRGVFPPEGLAKDECLMVTENLKKGGVEINFTYID